MYKDYRPEATPDETKIYYKEVLNAQGEWEIYGGFDNINNKNVIAVRLTEDTFAVRYTHEENKGWTIYKAELR